MKNLVTGIRRNWNRPSFWKQQFIERVLARVHNLYFAEQGMSVIEEDWDNLFILDGCRYDLFKEVYQQNQLPGELRSIRSRGSGSVEFLQNNFKGEELSDVVYISANPFVKTVLDDPFHRSEHVWIEGWDSEKQTVMPEKMSDTARALSERFPNKRLVVHYMQPHYPFVANEELQSGSFSVLRGKALETDQPTDNEEDVWTRLASGDVSQEKVWEAYRANLEMVLDSAHALAEDIRGKTVITSDHGNAIGERDPLSKLQIYGHPNGLQMASLRDVPWYVPPFDDRKEIHAEKPASFDDEVNEQVMEDRLQALGYT